MASKKLFRNIDEILTLEGASARQGRGIREEHLSIKQNYAIFSVGGVIEWIGPNNKVPKDIAKQKVKEVSLKGSTVLPGFVECHTHSVFAGSRAAEFEMRNQGVSYQEISAKGGGILSTVKAVREISPKKLLELTQSRVDEFIRQGVTTLEIKSGYGLTLKDEMKMLEVAKKIDGPRVITTFLGAHAKSKEFETYEAYLDYLTEGLQEIKKKKLSNRVDIFIEKGFFEKDSGQKYLEKARELGFQITIHADQLSLSGGSEVAVGVQALSADHLICVDEAQIQKLAKSEVTCVLLPAADLYMKCAYPPARKLIEAGARVALATDFNPGTSPTQDLNLVGLLARLEMKMTLPEVICAYSVSAAHALGLQTETGSLEVGKCADFVCSSDDWQNLFYQIGRSSITHVFQNGEIVAIDVAH
jgi:imidazolonepropionase